MNRKDCRSILGLSIFLLAGTFSGRAGADIRSDFDHDCDVDVADFAHFRMCALGPSVPQPNPACADARLDADQDVDLDDFGIFQRCYSGEGYAADPNCDPPCSGPDCACLCSQTNCNGTCTCTASDSANCGTCGNVCDAGLVCQNSSCQPCPAGLTACSGVCVYLPEDPQNCGSCGNVCPLGTSCLGGFCQPNDRGTPAPAPSASVSQSARVCPQPPCPGGGTRCSGACTNTNFDTLNCGGCGIRCADNQTCSGGVCQDGF